MAAVVAAASSDDLLCLLHCAAVARPTGMVYQPELLLAGAYAYAGQSAIPCLQSALVQTRYLLMMALVITCSAYSDVLHIVDIVSSLL